MRVSGYVLFLFGIALIAIKLLIELLVPIGIVLAILGIVLYFSSPSGKTKIKILRD